MPAKKEPKINLLPQQEFEVSTMGRILSWTLSSFRVIVILTEMVVMLTFLSRFWLDARLTDLNDLIKQKQAIIVSQSQFEKQFRLLQKRLVILASMWGSGQKSSDVLSILGPILPADVSLANFSQSGNAIEITGFSSSERSIAQLIANLESVNSFENVSLTNTSASPDNQSQLVFTIKFSSKKRGAS